MSSSSFFHYIQRTRREKKYLNLNSKDFSFLEKPDAAKSKKWCSVQYENQHFSEFLATFFLKPTKSGGVFLHEKYLPGVLFF
jgi:hypothetical protein